MMMLALPALVLIPFIGGLAAWLVGLRGASRAASVSSLITLVLMAILLAQVTLSALSGGASAGGWLGHFSMAWVPMLGINVRLDIDGLSLVMLWLNALISLPCALLSARNVADRAGLFHFLLLATVAGINGVFMATDLFLFFFFWELMLLPLFGVILIWGDAGRQRAALKFFLFTQGSGLLMLLAILGLVIVNAQRTGVITFDYFALSQTALIAPIAPVLMLGFFIAFAVKLPMVPFHSWLPDTYAASPAAASILLSGVLAKTGGYGLIRFVVMLFPGAAAHLAPIAMTLGVVGILYCAWLAVAQDDIKRLIAYSSISHLGFILLGVFSGTRIGMEGAIAQMVAHGLSTGALFVIAGLLEDRLGTRDMSRMGGLWPAMPQFSALAMFFAAASLGLPGLGNFVGEFLVLMGTWQVSHTMTFFAAAGLVLSSVYSLTMMLRVFYGPKKTDAVAPLGAPSVPHLAVLGVAALLLLALGVYPQPVLNLSAPASPHVVSIAQEQAQ